jgi:hypothetical protein
MKIHRILSLCLLISAVICQCSIIFCLLLMIPYKSGIFLDTLFAILYGAIFNLLLVIVFFSIVLYLFADDGHFLKFLILLSIYVFLTYLLLANNCLIIENGLKYQVIFSGILVDLLINTLFIFLLILTGKNAYISNLNKI